MMHLYTYLERGLWSEINCDTKSFFPGENCLKIQKDFLKNKSDPLTDGFT